MRLLTKTTLVILSGAILTIAVAALSVFMFTKPALQNLISEKQKETGRQTMDKIDRLFFGYYINIQSIAEEENIERMLGGEITDLRVIERRMKELPFLSGPWDALKIINSNGVIIVSDTQQKAGKYLLKESVDSAKALKEALSGRVYYSNFLISEETGRPTIIFSAPVRDQEKPNQPIVGAVLGYMAWPAVDEIINDNSSMDHLELYTHEGVLIAENQDNPEKLFVKNDAIALAIQESYSPAHLSSEIKNESGGMFSALIIYSNSTGYLAYKGNKWVLVTETPTAVIFAPAINIARNIILLLLPIILLTMILILVLIRRFVIQPVTNLTKVASIISKGDTTKRAEIKANDEIGQLAASFNEMVENVLSAEKERRALTEKYAKELEKTVEERTFELQSKVKELSESRLILESLAEDVQKEKEGVEIKVKERTRELKEGQARLVASINSLTAGFILFDLNDKIILKNSAVSRILEIPESETSIDGIKKYFEGIVDLEMYHNQCTKERKTIEVKSIAVGDKFLRLLLAPVVMIRDSDEVIGHIFLVEDITEEKTFERSREEFFAVASHELRTPLTAIRGNASMLQDFYADKIKDDDMRQMIGDIVTASKRLIKIVNDFLDVSRLEQKRNKFKKEEFDIAEIVDATLRELKDVASKKGLSLEFKRPSGALSVIADKDGVKQVLFNLLGNAINFTHQGGITVSAEKSGNFAKLYIKDTGIGISPQNQNMLFHKFQQAGEKILARDLAQGTGLGLYISKITTNEMGGEIALEESGLGKGSTFSVSLPLAGA